MPEQLRPESKDLGEATAFISHSIKAIIPNQGGSTPAGLTLNPKTRGLLRVHAFLHVYHSPHAGECGIGPGHECLDLLFFQIRHQGFPARGIELASDVV